MLLEQGVSVHRLKRTTELFNIVTARFAVEGATA